jgi:prolyl-tRNA editing enzyme YbaK/EbsC (Cys-tRNA(Pro) deacylase)
VRGALDVHRELLARDVPHEVVRLPSRLVSADDLPAALGLEDGCVVVRCYLVERDGRSSFAAVLVPAGAVPAPAALLDALSARSVRPARPEQVNATTDCTAGLVCPVGLPPDVEVLADAALEQSPRATAPSVVRRRARHPHADLLRAVRGAHRGPDTGPRRPSSYGSDHRAGPAAGRATRRRDPHARTRPRGPVRRAGTRRPTYCDAMSPPP